MTDLDRRTFLAQALATGAAVGLAGCTGGNDGDGMETSGMDETDSMDGAMTESGMTEAGEMNEGMTDNEMTAEGAESEMTEEGMGGEPTETGSMMAPRTFEVTVTNVSQPGTITISAGEDVAVPLSPVAYAVHSADVTAFAEGESASDGLESLAEDGDPSGLGSELDGADGVAASGAVTTADGADGPGPLMPGQRYTFEVSAGPGDRLTLATMFVQSNDLFYAPESAGMALFDGEQPVDGDLTDRLVLWDAGTERNEEPGVGPTQAPRQSGPNTGADENGVVRRIDGVDDGFTYPATADVIELTISPTESMN